MSGTRRSDDMRKWGQIGHPVTSRGLSPNDKSPWLTLIITTLACFALAKAFLVLQSNYETEGASWALAHMPPASALPAEGGGVDAGEAAALSAAAGAGEPRRAGGAGAAAAAAEALSATRAAATADADASVSGGAAVTAAAGGDGGAAALALTGVGPSPLDGMDASCNAELNVDLDGHAVSWGLDFKTARRTRRGSGGARGRMRSACGFPSLSLASRGFARTSSRARCCCAH
jgi:hypothetical protein